MNHSAFARYGWIATVAVLIACEPRPASAVILTFSNPTELSWSSGGNAVPALYPSPISVSGVVPSSVTDVNVRLLNFNHDLLEEVQLLLVGPTGLRLLLMNNAGGDRDAVMMNLTFDDEAAAPLAFSPMSNPPTSSYQLSRYGSITDFPMVPPTSMAESTNTLAQYDGLDPNGIWNLYVYDNFSSSGPGSINGGWELILTADELAPPAAVPEPASVVAFGVGLLALTARVRWRRRSGRRHGPAVSPQRRYSWCSRSK